MHLKNGYELDIYKLGSQLVQPYSLRKTNLHYLRVPLFALLRPVKKPSRFKKKPSLTSRLLRGGEGGHWFNDYLLVVEIEHSKLQPCNGISLFPQLLLTFWSCKRLEFWNFRGGDFSNIFGGNFQPQYGEDEPILTFRLFQMGWFNHQLEKDIYTNLVP